jgi:hypothetical protein
MTFVFLAIAAAGTALLLTSGLPFLGGLVLITGFSVLLWLLRPAFFPRLRPKPAGPREGLRSKQSG